MPYISTGLTAPRTYSAISSFHRTMSILSPDSSRTISLTREPLMPTQAPTESTLSSFDRTDIFVLSPASLAIATISKIPCEISGTSNSNSFFTNIGLDRVRIISNPPVFLSTLSKHARIISPCLNLSLGICSDLGNTASVSFSSTIMLPFSNR